MAIVEGLREEFADHDVFLHLLLGLASVARRSERWLPPAPPPPPPEPAPLLEGEAERRVLVLLGFISMRRTLLGALEPARASVPASAGTEAPAAPRGPPRTLDLLR